MKEKWASDFKVSRGYLFKKTERELKAAQKAYREATSTKEMREATKAKEDAARRLASLLGGDS